MGSAVLNLQKAILASNQSLTQLLRQAKVIAGSLTLGDVESWVDSELKGYPPDAGLPAYRQICTETVEICNPEKGWAFAGLYHCKLPTREPVAEIEDFPKEAWLYTPMQRN